MSKLIKETLPISGPRKVPILHVLVTVILILLWQLGFYLSKSNLNDQYRNLAATGIGENFSTFAYFYHYLDLFPLTSTLLFSEDGLPKKYWSRDGALSLIEEAPETLLMDFEGYVRTGDYGKIWLFLPEIMLTGNPNNLNVHEFLALAFTSSLIALLVAFWRVNRFRLGLALVIFLGSHPYQLYEVYKNPNVFQNMGNWFSIPITSFVFFLAAFAPLIFGEKLSRISIVGLSILAGAYFGTVSHIRLELAVLVISS